MDEKIFSLSGGGNSFQMALVVFYYFLQWQQGKTQVEAFSEAAILARAILATPARQSLMNWETANVNRHLNWGAICQHQKTKSTSLDLKKSEPDNVELSSEYQAKIQMMYRSTAKAKFMVQEDFDRLGTNDYSHTAGVKFIGATKTNIQASNEVYKIKKWTWYKLLNWVDQQKW